MILSYILILLYQFSRNIYRDSPKSFENDGLVLYLAKKAIKLNKDKELPNDKRAFLYMPFMHSENISDQNLIDIINWYENKSDFKINEVE